MSDTSRPGSRRSITPWNAPLMLSTWKIGPALAAGDTVVLKPPEWAPLSCSLLAEIAARAGVPPGVFNVVQGAGPEAGQALVEHPGVDRISFTGSTATGRVVAGIAASRVVPVSLELGGKSPLLVFDDADLDDAAATVASQFNNAGQVCLAGTRVLVASSIDARFRARVLRAAGELVVGDPRQRGVRVGPLIHPRQLERVAGLVRRAIDGGASAILGGAPHERGGLYYQPTILDRTSVRATRLSRRRSSGRCSPGRRSTPRKRRSSWPTGPSYGLAAVIYTRDPARAERICATNRRRARSGSIATSCATSKRRSGARDGPASAARAARGASTSSAT